jgi:hypothetical protein
MGSSCQPAAGVSLNGLAAAQSANVRIGRTAFRAARTRLKNCNAGLAVAESAYLIG